MRVSSEWVREGGGGKSSEGSGLGHLSIIYTTNTCNRTQTRIQQNSFRSLHLFSKLQDLNHVDVFVFLASHVTPKSEQLENITMSLKNILQKCLQDQNRMMIRYKSFVKWGKVIAFVCPKLSSDIVIADFQIRAAMIETLHNAPTVN